MKDRLLIIIFVGVVALICVGMARLTIDAVQALRGEVEAVAARQAEGDAAIARLHGRVIAEQTDIQFIRTTVFQQSLNAQDEAIRQAHRTSVGK